MPSLPAVRREQARERCCALRNNPTLAGDFMGAAAFFSWCTACSDPLGTFQLNSFPTQALRALLRDLSILGPGHWESLGNWNTLVYPHCFGWQTKLISFWLWGVQIRSVFLKLEVIISSKGTQKALTLSLQKFHLSGFSRGHTKTRDKPKGGQVMQGVSLFSEVQ